MMQINKDFQRIWWARLISILGTGLTGFGLSVWVFSCTGKATPMAITMLCSILPSILLAPFSGVLCDKFNRKKIIILADSLAALISILIWIYLNIGDFSFGIVCLFVLSSSAANTFDNNAYQASISTLVAKEELKKANGLNQLIDSLSNIASPILAGILYAFVGLKGIIVIDLLSYCVSMLLFLKVDREKFTNPKLLKKNREGKVAVWEGLKFIASQKSLMVLLIYFTLLNFLFNISVTLIEPFTLTIGNSMDLGFIKASGGIGLLCGSLYVSFYKFKWNPSAVICFGVFSAGAALMLMGASELIFLIALGRLLFCCSVPVTNTIAGTLWLAKTPQELQGRVFASRVMIAKCFMPFSYLLVGPLVDRVLPILLKSEAGRFLKYVLGGKSMEYRLVFLGVGVIIMLITLAIAFNKSFRELDN
ncbi:MAG: MFS transporter [Lachnospiraceae bacterium]|nr:MFS transporter [Lachnospiraceae bacterium]